MIGNYIYLIRNFEGTLDKTFSEIESVVKQGNIVAIVTDSENKITLDYVLGFERSEEGFVISALTGSFIAESEDGYPISDK